VMPNAETFSHALLACAKEGDAEYALRLMSSMREKGIRPDEFCWRYAIVACAKGGNPVKAVSFLNAMERRRFALDARLISQVVGACAKAGMMDEIERLVKNIPESSLPQTLEVYNALIQTYAKQSKGKEDVMRVMEQMEKHGVKPDVFSYGGAIDACARHGDWEGATMLLEKLKSEGLQPNVVLYSSAINACAQGGNRDLALDFLRQMRREGIVVNQVAYSSAMLACLTADDFKGEKHESNHYYSM